jgi:hypothetical protein
METPPNARAFPRTFVLCLLGCLALALAVNVFGNGTNLIPSPFFSPSTCIRAWKARRLASLAAAGKSPDALIIGSSRVFSLEEQAVRDLSGLSAFNFGVSVGCPVDFLAELRFALDVGVRPRVIIVGVDELAMGDNPEADHYDMQLVTDGRLFRDLDLRDRIPIMARVLKTISMRSTTDSARNLWHWFRAGGLHQPVADPPESALEGARPLDWEGLSASERERRLRAGIDEKVEFWGKYLDRPDKVAGMSPTARKIALFDAFLDLAAAKGIKVYVTLLPAQPDFERRAFPPPVLEIRNHLAQYLRKACDQRGDVFGDYTNLASFGGEANEFSDGTHMTPKNARRLLAKLLTVHGDETRPRDVAGLQ